MSKYDFLALQNVQPTGNARLRLALFTPTNLGRVCTGVQKLAQRWLLEFTTVTGSMPGLPNRGTFFMALAQSGRLRTTAALTAQFSIANYIVKVNLQNEEDDTWPDDERFLSAELAGLEFSPGSAKLYVTIYSRALAARQVVLPVKTLPVN